MGADTDAAPLGLAGALAALMRKKEAAHAPQVRREGVQQAAPGVPGEARPAGAEGYRQQGDLTNYLSSVGQQAESLFETLLGQKNNQVQDLPHFQKVAALQSHPAEADEVVMHDLVLQPVPEDEDQESD